MKSIAILIVAILLCPAFAFAADDMTPVVVDEAVVVAEDAETGDVIAEAVEMDETLAPMSAKDIKAEAKEEIKEVKEEAKEAIKDIKAEEKEALEEVTL